MLTRTLATLALALFAVSSPVPAGPGTYNFKYRIANLQTQQTPSPNELIVFNPTITSPTPNLQWVMGQTYNATWVTNNIPPEKQNATGFILLGHAGNNSENLDIQHPLATNFPLANGWAPITMPWAVAPRNDYFIVLFGDSGNTSPQFSIIPSANGTTADTDDSL